MLLATGLSAQVTSSDSPYHFSLKREASYAGLGLLTIGAGTYYQSRIPELTLSDLRLNDYAEVNIIDKVYGRDDGNERARLLSDKVLNFSAALPAVLLLGKKTRRDLPKIGLLYLETMAIAGGITNLTKATILRTRPYVFHDDFGNDRILESGDRASFISGHTSLSAAGTFFFARVFSDYYPESKLKPYVWGAAILLPATAGYLRIKAAKHFPSDVLAGYAVGATIGYLVPTLHKRAILPKGMALSGGAHGVYFSYRF